MASKVSFTEEEMEIEQILGYPKAYTKLCRNPQFNPFSKGPPVTFIPYPLQSQEALRARELNQLFPVIDSERKPCANPKNFVDLLWKRLNHLGNAGFDPALFRVDPYGNVLYYYADSASPLAWEIDHWFPCSRGGKTVPGNLRLLQWQVCKKKKNKLEFLIPWWDLQLGISINQFLSVFASRNSDFRNRAFSLLFTEAENEEFDSSQVFDCHSFPQHFMEKKRQVGLAPAAIVLLQRDSDPLKSLDLNRPPRPTSSAARKFVLQEDEDLSRAIQKFRPSMCKENEELDLSNQFAVIARESLKQKEEIEKKQTEICKLEEEIDDLKQKNEIERHSLQDLECLLIKRRRRVEKCRRLAEAQSSYRALLEKMIRDAMHQSVVYKEQVRLNQAANSALMARLEAQKAICDSSERELQKRYKQRDEIEKQIRPNWEQARKRSRMDDASIEEKYDKKFHLFPVTNKPSRSLQKELRLFLEEEQKASEAGISLDEDHEKEEEEENEETEAKELAVAQMAENCREDNSSMKVSEQEQGLDNMIEKLAIEDGICSEPEKFKSSFARKPIEEDDEEHRKKIGKGNVDKWLEMLLNMQEGSTSDTPLNYSDECAKSKTEELVRKMNSMNPQQEIKILRLKAKEEPGDIDQENTGSDPNCVELRLEEREAEKVTEERGEMSSGKMLGKGNGYEENVGLGKGVGMGKKERGLVRSESARVFGSIPASPSVIWGMRKGVDCMGKKPMVDGEDDDHVDENHAMVKNKFIKTSIKALKKAVKK